MAKLFSKYTIQKTDGTPIDPEAQYFVLRIDTDEHARRALATYIFSVMRDDEGFAKELWDWLCRYMPSLREPPYFCDPERR